MNPELIERPYEVAYYKSLEQEKESGSVLALLTGLVIGFNLGLFWYWIIGLIF